jgi:DNA-binding transcriptional ArsR family regulator
MSVAAVFNALGDDVRLRLVGKLSRVGPMPLGKLAEGEGVTRQAVSKHLNVLLNSGLAEAERKGREQIWSVKSDGLREAERYLDQISRDWDRAIERLRAFLED